MRFRVAGFNLFKQWSNHDAVIKEFTEVMVQECDDTDLEILFVRWSYNVFKIGSNVFMSGLYSGNEMQLREIKLPSEVFWTSTNLVLSGNDHYLLLLDRINQIIWKRDLGKSTEVDWSSITPFWNVEAPLESSNDENERTALVDIDAGHIMNLCLSSKGCIYNIPQKINVSHCLGNVIQFECGNEHAIILTDRGNVYTWGNGRRCQLGHGDLRNAEEPQLVEALAGVRIARVRAGGWHSCALSHSRDLYVWGWNDAGQLGVRASSQHHTADGSPLLKKLKNHNRDSVASTALPTLVDLYESETAECPVECNIVDVACGSKHTVLILDDNSVWVAGSNMYGQLGVGTDSRENVKHFKKVLHSSTECKVICGPWTTVVITD